MSAMVTSPYGYDHGIPSRLYMEITHVLLITFSAVTIAINVPLLCLIYVHPRLRKAKEVILIGFVCFADMCNAFSFFFAGIERIRLINADQVQVLVPHTRCQQLPFSYIFICSYQAVGISILTVTIDRCFAVLWPTKYMTKADHRYAYGMLIGGALYIAIGYTVCLISWFSSPPIMTSPMCYSSSAFTPAIWKYLVHFRQGAITISGILYIPIAIRVYQLQKRMVSIKFASSNNERVHTRRLVKATVLIGITLFFELTLVFFPDTATDTNLFNLRKYEMILYLVICTKGIVNIFLYSSKNDDIRKVLTSVFCPPKNQKAKGAHSSYLTATTGSNYSRRFE